MTACGTFTLKIAMNYTIHLFIVDFVEPKFINYCCIIHIFMKNHAFTDCVAG